MVLTGHVCGVGPEVAFILCKFSRSDKCRLPWMDQGGHRPAEGSRQNLAASQSEAQNHRTSWTTLVMFSLRFRCTAVSPDNLLEGSSLLSFPRQGCRAGATPDGAYVSSAVYIYPVDWM